MPRTTLSKCAALIAIVIGLALTACSTLSSAADPFPGRVLLTNDNGIDDIGLLELARAFARVPGIEVIVVAASRDRSGTSNFLGATNSGRYHVQRRNLGANIQAWELDGYPADCVVFALTGPLRDRLPDLVVSGINGGPNLGDDWFGSGTIGAARTAAYFGIPAVAVSGLEDDHAGAVAAATSWVVRFVQSGIVASLEAPQYLTVSLPSGMPPHITGARIVERSRGQTVATSRPVEDTGSAAVWQIEIETHETRAAAGTDVTTVSAGHIAIVPMRVNEYDPALAERLRERADRIPEWLAPAGSATGSDYTCRASFGATVDDAEDPAGREWGVLIEKVSDTGLANAAGLRAGDVVVALNGTPLESQRGDSEDPDDRFVRLLRSLPCGSGLVLEYVRESRRHTTRFTWDI